jgi:hypothetical protein
VLPSSGRRGEGFILRWTDPLDRASLDPRMHHSSNSPRLLLDDKVGSDFETLCFEKNYDRQCPK